MPTKAELENELAAVYEQFATYKTRVRGAALDAAESENWCRAGLNGALRDLDLEPVVDEFDVRITVVASRTFTIRVQAEDDDTADEQADEMNLRDLEQFGVVLPDGWEHDSHETESVDRVYQTA